MKFKLLISSILIAVSISTTVFAQINDETLNIISSEKEKIVSNGYEISNQFKILVNENQLTLKNGTLVFSGRTYLPIRELSTFLNASIDYDAENKVSILSKDDVIIQVPQNRTKATVIKDNVTTVLNMDTDSNIQSIVLDGVTYLPLRFIAENLGYDVVYSPEIKTIKLNEKNLNNANSTVETTAESTTFETNTLKTTQQDTSIQNNLNVKALYIGNKENQKLHKLSCKYVDKMLPENMAKFENKENAISSGYTDLCKVCNP